MNSLSTQLLETVQILPRCLLSTRHITYYAKALPRIIPREEESLLSVKRKEGEGGASHHDLQQWLERSSDSNQRASLGRSGLAGNLFEATFRLLTFLLEAVRPSDKVTLKDKQKCRNEIERLFLWGDGFGAGDGSLDDTLDKSTELKISVLSLLSELGILATRSMLRVPLLI